MDSRRYHRRPEPRAVRHWWLASSAAGSGAATSAAAGAAASGAGAGAAGAAGSAGLGAAALQALQSGYQQSGLSNLVQAAQQMVPQTEAGHLAALGQQVPQGVQLVGPSATFGGGDALGHFAQGFQKGFMGVSGADPTLGAGGQFGQGIGQLLAGNHQMNGAQLLQSILGQYGMQGPATKNLASQPQAPQSGMQHGLFNFDFFGHTGVGQ